MRKLKRTHGMIFAVVAASLSLGCLGFATYAIETNALDKSLAIQNTTERAVCYVNNSEGNTTGKYTTIEKGLANASSGDTVYVYPGLTDDNGDLYKINITEDCEIKSGVTLSLPYEGTTTFKQSAIASSFADSNESGVKTNRATQVIVADGKKITNNGSLIIGGNSGIGVSEQKPSGHTAGKYAELTMSTNSQIVNNGEIKVYGYIKESSSDNESCIINNANSSTTLPLVLYDFRGGTYMSNCVDNKIFPFNSFDMPNCQVKESFESGSKLIGTLLIHRNLYTADCSILSNDESSLFVLSSGSLSIKYHSASPLYTTNDVITTTTSESANITTIETSGDVKLNKIAMTVMGYSVDSSQYFCPIPSKFQITCFNGTFSIENKMKFLGGSSLTVKENATLAINAETSFYQNYVQKIVTGGSVYPNFDTAKLTIFGKMNISQGGFGGIIEIGQKGAELTVADGLTQPIVTSEQLRGYTSDGYVTDKHYEYGKSYFSEQECVDGASLLSSVGSGTFQSNDKYWVADKVSPSESIDALQIAGQSGKSAENKAQSFEIKAYYSPAYNNCSELVYTWSCDKGDSYLSTTIGDSIVLSLPANGGDSDITYKITCTLSYKDSSGELKTLSTESSDYKAVADSCVLPSARVLMADGTYKKAGSIVAGDMVMTLNHETGKFEAEPVVLNYHTNESARDATVLHLQFDNGKSTDLINAHGYFDVDLNEYVYIHVDDFEKYIGHRFVFVDSDLNMTVSTLVSGSVASIYTEVVSPITANNINFIADDMLSLTFGLDGLFNIFDYDAETLAYDQTKMQADIEQYGLLDYEVFEPYISRDIYDMFPCKYLAVSIGKGLTTWENIERYIRIWKYLFAN